MPAKKTPFILLIRYTRDLVRFSPGRISQLILVSLLNGFTQGIGLFMLIPFLHMFGIGASRAVSHPHWVIAWLGHLFQRLHIPTTLATILPVFFVLMAISAMLKYRQTTLTNTIQRTYTRQLQIRLFAAVIRAQWRFIADRKASGITHLATYDLPVVASGTFFFLQIMSTFSLAVCYIFWAASISIHLTGLVLASAGLSVFLFRSHFLKTYRAGGFMRNATAGVFSVLMDHIANVKIAKCYGAEKREYEKFWGLSGEVAAESVRIIRQNANMTLGFQMMSNLVLCLILYYAIEVLDIPLVEVGIAVIIFSKLVPILVTLQSHLHRLIAMLPSFEAAENFHRAAETWAEALEDKPDFRPLNLSTGILLKNVSFSHKTDDKGPPGFTLWDVNLQIPAFKTTAICGPSGAGKSTLADLVSGILVPDTGTIEIDGIALDKKNLLSWRKTVGYVPQEGLLFNNTIRDNILWGNPDASGTEVENALKLASTDRFIQTLPNGMDTVIKDRGNRLSGGERQRIALARALVRSPGLLILDEATNALDRANEAAIFNALSGLRGKMTILIISHSHALLRHADQIIYLKNGRVTPNGKGNS